MADTMERRTAADTALRLRGVHHLALNTDDMAKTVDFYVRGRLSHQRLDPVLDIARVATVGEAPGEPTHQPQSAIHLSQEQRTRVRRDVAAIKTGHRVRLNRSKLEQLRDTFMSASGRRLDEREIVPSQEFSPASQPRCTSRV